MASGGPGVLRSEDDVQVIERVVLIINAYADAYILGVRVDHDLVVLRALEQTHIRPLNPRPSPMV